MSRKCYMFKIPMIMNCIYPGYTAVDVTTPLRIRIVNS